MLPSVTAGMAFHVDQATMKVENIRATRGLQQPVDILGQDMNRPSSLPTGDRQMGTIGRNVRRGRASLTVEAMNQLMVPSPIFKVANDFNIGSIPKTIGVTKRLKS